MFKRVIASAVVSLGLLVSSSAGALAQTVEEFYSGNTLTLIVSAAPGGGADFYGRTFAPFLSKHLPGNPEVIIQNLAGAGGMQAAIRLNSAVPDDGTVMALLQRNNFYLPLISEEEIPFKPLDVHWIGSINSERYVMMTMTDATPQTTEDLFNKTVRLGATGFANENRVIPAMLNKFYGTKFDIVTGYDGSPAMALAMERGEIDGRMQVVSALTHGSDATWLNEERIKILIQVGTGKSSAFPDVPNILDYSDDPHVTAVATFLLSPLDVSIPLAVPPGVPEDRVAALRKAFDDASKDPELLVALEAGRGPAELHPGEYVQGIVEGLWATPEPVLDEIRALLKPE